ncbi:Paf1p NDAI_0B04840 [Naumovozyma dairenensis CBS 421]|uniref:Uncharacterized protein n=1 Tax=Naumovozyma dairenensis (strain ATCC 10597 / BCRC 20456 / CBS 421 / NBRC 0211 / NRRL Y-12639) TaxID=1071378 RepID=G0W6V7_NAUDC|nr:hypothetical protein NDAI_0B04840 [Naumovozyma dairenensis CBS 421]CCD23518.1 hypothetical protein NDAI_0B04840 [Naumovozyma dairenensis CBS 421]
MSRKQEYIAKIKYQNNLPPPLLPPKLLNYPEDPIGNVDSPQLLTSLYTKTNVTPLINLNDDLGMPLDLIQIPNLLNNADTKYLYGLTENNNNIILHQKDRVLLRDPRIDRLTKTDISKVTFLRRTEYVSSTIASHANNNGTSTATMIKKRTRSEEDEDELLNASQILQKVENKFEAMHTANSTDDLSGLKHPIKKKIHAVKTWNLLPDTAAMDQSYFTLRLVGSAALDKQEKNKLALSTAIFRPVELEEDEWISMYTTDKSNSKIISQSMEKNIDDVKSNASVNDDEDDDKTFKFKRLRDFDMKQVPNLNPSVNQAFGELAIMLNNEKGIAYYKPLRPRIELRRRRVNDVFKPLVRQYDIDQINVSLRNPTTQEANLRDRLRMKFDPINFATVDDDDEEDDDHEEKEVEKEEQGDRDEEKKNVEEEEKEENTNTQETSDAEKEQIEQ